MLKSLAFQGLKAEGISYGGPLSHRLPASADATTDLAETLVFKDGRLGTSNREGGAKVRAITFIPDVGATSQAADNTNYWTLTVTKYVKGGTGALVAATKTTKITGGVAIAAQVEIVLALSGTAANFTLSAGDQLTFKAAHTATPAAAFPAGLLVIDIDAPL